MKTMNLVVLLSSLVFAIALGEALIRFLLFSGHFNEQVVKLSGFVGNAYVDDTKYCVQLKAKLQSKSDKFFFPKFHQLLGWCDPMMSLKDSCSNRQQILFFGDSFTKGFTSPQYSIPSLVDSSLKEVSVANLGVSGYGLDQIYLLLKSVIADRPDSHVIIGLFYNDIDRCILKVREAPKPYFEISDGELVLKGVPIPSDFQKWLQTYKPPAKSYFLASCDGIIRRVLTTRWAVEYLFAFHPSQSDRLRNEKKTLCRKLVEAIKQECESKNATLTVVLFPHLEHLIHEGWRERFVRELLIELAIDFIDMEVPLKQYLQNENLTWWRDIYTLSSHPNRFENQLMAEYIANFLSHRYGYHQKKT